MSDEARRQTRYTTWLFTIVVSVLVGAGAIVGTAFVRKWNFDTHAQPTGDAAADLARINESLRLQLAAKDQEIKGLQSRSAPVPTTLPPSQPENPGGNDSTNASSAVSARNTSAPPPAAVATQTEQQPVNATSTDPQDRLFTLRDIVIEEGAYRVEATSLQFLPNHTMRLNLLHTNKTTSIFTIAAPGARGESYIVDSLGDQYDLVDSENIGNGGRSIPPRATIRYAIVFRSPPVDTSKLAIVLRMRPDQEGWRTLSLPQVYLR